MFTISASCVRCYDANRSGCSFEQLLRLRDELHTAMSNIWGCPLMRPLQAEWRLIMTGTPLQNNLNELFCLLAFLEEASPFAQHLYMYLCVP